MTRAGFWHKFHKSNSILIHKLVIQFDYQFDQCNIDYYGYIFDTVHAKFSQGTKKNLSTNAENIHDISVVHELVVVLLYYSMNIKINWFV